MLSCRVLFLLRVSSVRHVPLGKFDAPCRTKNVAREIPSPTFQRSLFAHMFLGGFLPFCAISVELYYIFASVSWKRTGEYYFLELACTIKLVVMRLARPLTDVWHIFLRPGLRAR